MICGSTTSPFYYGFMCEENWFWGQLHLSLVFCSCFLAVFVTLAFNSMKLNAIVYVVAAHSTIPGLVHLAYYTSAESVHTFYIWPWIFVGGQPYVIGAVIYALKIPERWFPRTFDIWLQSHTIFHLLILVGASIHIWSSLRVFHERQLFPCPANGIIGTPHGAGYFNHDVKFLALCTRRSA